MMASTGRGGPSKQSKGCPPLSDQGHKEVMDLLRMTEKSAYPDIRKAALDLAKQTSKYRRKQGARVSPTLILWVNIVLGSAVVLACWHAFLHYPRGLAYELSSISILLFLLVVAISLVLSGHLSQANFMKVLNAAVSHIRAWKSSPHKAPEDTRPQDEEQSDGDIVSPKK
jgi:small-conductance mechanosensitive channel